MPSLPADRTKLALAQGNQVPSVVIASAKNINAITEIYDTVDLLNQNLLSYQSGSSRIIDGGSFTDTAFVGTYDGGTF